MSQALFRQEVIETHTGRWLGNVRLAQSLPFWIASAIAVVLACSLVAYGILGSYTRKAHVTGVLAPQGGEINIAASVAGRVADLRVAEGSIVADGDVLLVLDTDHAMAMAVPGGIGDTAALVSQQIGTRRLTLQNERSLRENQAQLRRQAIRARLRNLDGELAKIDDEISLQGQRKAFAEKSVHRYEELAAARFVSPIQVQTQQEALIDQSSRLRSLERARLNLSRERTGLLAEETQSDADLATNLASLDGELAKLEQEAAENAARRTSVVVAPKAGVVSALGVGIGQAVTAGQALAAIHPQNAPLEAQLYAPSRAAGFISPGQSVFVRYAAFPYQKFGLQSGKVTAVSQSAFAPSDLPPALQSQFGRQSNEALYRITVAIASQNIATYGDARPLKAGMALEADIVQDRRTIVEWLLEPLFAMARRT
jgi:membrane fusion protein